MSDDRRSTAVDILRAGRTVPQFQRRWVVGGLITSAALGLLNGGAKAASALNTQVPNSQVANAQAHSLVMVEDDGCVYCVRWHEECGAAYANSAEGRFAPLARHRIRDPGIAFLKNVRYTPTFVLLHGDTEIGRITGYPGANSFWELLAGLMAKAGFNEPGKSAPVDDIKT
jgi:hypothetical protein